MSNFVDNFRNLNLLFFVVAEINACIPNPCKNGGVCEDVAGVPVCRCPAPYVGAFCDGK